MHRIFCTFLLLVVTTQCGCSIKSHFTQQDTIKEVIQISDTNSSQTSESVEPDSLEISISDPDSNLTSISLSGIINDRPFINQLESLYRSALSLLSVNDLESAEEILYLLNSESQNMANTQCDSVSDIYLSSLNRRTSFLAAVLAEEHNILSSFVGNDSLLSDAYKNLQGLSFPDSLIPITGVQQTAIASDLLNIRNPRVQKWLDHYTGKGRISMEKWLFRKTAIDSLLCNMLSEAGLPNELIYHALIESGFSNNAVSRVGAVGPWQFMPATGKHFGLRTDWWVDERQDFEFSTKAAITYLTQLYRHFGDWALALAAYNAGEHRIYRAIKLAGHDDYWNLHLPWETRNHIPKFIAVAEIGMHPQKYGFEIKEQEKLEYDTIMVTDATGIDLISKCAGVNIETVRNLNPALIRSATPPGNSEYPVKVPKGTGKKCMRKLVKIPFDQRLTWRKHTVKSGQSIGLIANQYGTSVKDIVSLNKIGKNYVIHPGDKLLIPMPAILQKRAAKRHQEKGHYVPPSNYKRVIYKVKSGDTLSGIATKLGVSLKHLRRVNNMKKGSIIRPGDRIYAYKP